MDEELESAQNLTLDDLLRKAEAGQPTELANDPPMFTNHPRIESSAEGWVVVMGDESSHSTIYGKLEFELID